MNKYGQAAIKAVSLLHSKNASSPGDAWQVATTEVFGAGTPSQAKGCPRNAFLALCETGMVKGVKAGSYTKSTKNKEYALKALNLLQKEKHALNDSKTLWNEVIGGDSKIHNSQMDVVLALWNMDFISKKYIKKL